MPDPTALTMADVLGKTGPALSATSDMPVAAPLAPAPTPAAPTPAPAEAPAEAPAPAPAEAETKDETPAWMKAEITKERNRRREAEARQAESERLLKEALERIPKPAAEAPAPAETPKPKRADFDDPDAYDDALIAWGTQRAAAQLRTEQQTESQRQAEAAAQAKQSEQQKVVQQAWAGRRDKALAEMPDYVEVAENPDVQISMPMAAVITSVENGPQVAYHLGKNPAEAARIAALSPFEAAVEVRLISRDLAAKKAEITKAPDPVTRVGARSTAAPKSAQEESMEEYAARRTKELQSAARRH